MLSFFPSSLLMLSLPSRVFGCVAIVYSYNPHSGKVYVFSPSESSGESYLEVELVIESLPFSTQDVQVQEVIAKELTIEKPTMKQERKIDTMESNTKVPQQVQLSESEVSIPNNPIGEVTDDMKGKQSCVKYPVSQFVCTNHLSVQHQSFIVAIDAIKTLTSVQEALKDENWVQATKEEMKALEKSSTWENC
ncbi:hypothetical protein CR513_10095, partial [Mucuna pruriens]